jgi:predicted transcriptional regulator
MKPAPLSKPTPVRLNATTKPQLDHVARKFRLSPAQIIRLAVDEKLSEWIKSGKIQIEAN